MQILKKKIERKLIAMDTVISLTVVSSKSEKDIQKSLSRVFDIFHNIESSCSRFDPDSELRLLSSSTGNPVKVSDILFQAILFSVELSKATNGAFDITVGNALEKQGFNKNYLTGEINSSDFRAGLNVSYKDVLIDEKKQTVMLTKPLILDLGAVAKGLAVDLARRELDEFEGFCINAGGDIFAKGVNGIGTPWKVGIQHPLDSMQILCKLKISDCAVCTSGSYERKSKKNNRVHHLFDPVKQISSNEILSCTAISPFAMLSDALSTAAFILGPEKGLILLEEHGAEGIMITPALELKVTSGIERYYYE
ncbi:FAD:protein FMN transferase [Bacillus sp. MUM 13]|uniref:FAD:protein FMN transferase n=1 Tax=Bacillus sp. MUM 13 TaxID=1678001 RepID=UPI001F0A6D98|nr:FAD:protein FMN transferase [Bacillus sp. MUM 13]